MRVLIVDDSAVFRGQIRNALENVADFTISGVAQNGALAMQFLQNGSIDLVTLDIEMPVMNGFETLSEIRRLGLKCHVIVLTSRGGNGADAALQALSLGASDFIVKPTAGSVEEGIEKIRQELIPKVLQFKNVAASPRPLSVKPLAPIEVIKGSVSTPSDISAKQVKALVIASSTGGPNALQSIFADLPLNSKTPPIVIAQHMPQGFTQSLASHLSRVSKISFEEAADGMKIENGKAYVAPGDYHLFLRKAGDYVVCHIDQSLKRNSVRPAADHLFETAAAIYGKQLLGVVLTGMGEDGAMGAKSIKENGGRTIIQNKESSTVWGMPGAVSSLNLADGVFDIAQIRTILSQLNQ
jgi:two-component system chemotaxis response regulator CheB